VGGGIALYSIYQGSDRILATFEKQAWEITAIISSNIANELYYLNLAEASLRLQATRVNPDVRQTYVMDLDGRVLIDGTRENVLRDEKLADPFSNKVLLSDHWISGIERDTLKIGGPILLADGKRIGYLQVGFSLGRIHQIIEDTTRTSLYITLICLGIGAILAVILSTGFTRPILSIVRASKEIGEGKLDTRLDIKRGDELGVLADSINHMAANLSSLYNELRNQTIELDRANKVKMEFLSVTSHELRTPLNVVMGYVGMIHDKILGEINPEQEQALGKVLRQSEHLLTTINGVMEVTKIEAGAVVVENQEVKPRDLLEDLRSCYDLPLDKEVTLTWNYPPELPPIKTDSGKLRQILQNLIDNAIKFTDKGHVTVAARCVIAECAGNGTEGNGRNGFLEFRVTDTGIGIPEELLPAIFDRFRQGDSSETRSHGGVGLGLYIVKNFTELLGGKVDVESQPGKGSTFSVLIPNEKQAAHDQGPLGRTLGS
jgi:signal transduction histidine kinase